MLHLSVHAIFENHQLWYAEGICILGPVKSFRLVCVLNKLTIGAATISPAMLSSGTKIAFRESWNPFVSSYCMAAIMLSSSIFAFTSHSIFSVILLGIPRPGTRKIVYRVKGSGNFHMHACTHYVQALFL